MLGQAHGTDGPESETRSAPLAIRLAWFVGIWMASVSLLGIVAYVIRIWLRVD